MIQTAAFYALSSLLIVSAVLVVTQRNMFNAALWLAAALSLVAGLFVLLGADFLAAAQLLLYVGGVIVIIAFAVMLSSVQSAKLEHQTNAQWVPALFGCAGLLALMVRIFLKSPFAAEASPRLPTTAALGGLLLRDMALPFEAVSLALMASLLGAVLFSRKEDPQR